jgi:hypothetical protein
MRARCHQTIAPQEREQLPDKTVIRPFGVDVPEAELAELRRRIVATKWPDRNDHDQSQGVQLARISLLRRRALHCYFL